MTQHDRITVVDKFYFEPAGGKSRLFETKFWHDLKSIEQLWERSCIGNETWKQLDLGWLNGQPVGMIVIENNEGKFYDKNPTPEERLAVAARVLHLAILGENEVPTDATPWLSIWPGGGFKGKPSPSARLWVRSPSGSLRYTVVAVAE